MASHPLIRLLCAAVTVGVMLVTHAEDTPSNMGPAASDQLVTARAAIAAKDWPRALAELNAAVKAEPRNADVHNLLGYSHRKKAQPDLAKAFEHYKLALQIDPGHKGAHEYIGEAYLMAQQPAMAEQHLAALRRLCGNSTCEEYVDLAEAIKAYNTRRPS
jgi:tetratricopeptide (TPR) repeat protein